MPDKKRRVIATDVDWLKGKAFYLSSPSVSYSDVAKILGVSKTSVVVRAQTDKWQDAKVIVNQQTDLKLTENISTTIADAKAKMAEIAMKAMVVVDSSLETVRPIKVKTVMDVSAAMGALQTAQKVYLTAIGEEANPVQPVVILLKTTTGNEIDLTRII